MFRHEWLICHKGIWSIWGRDLSRSSCKVPWSECNSLRQGRKPHILRKGALVIEILNQLVLVVVGWQKELAGKERPTMWFHLLWGFYKSSKCRSYLLWPKLQVSILCFSNSKLSGEIYTEGLVSDPMISPPKRSCPAITTLQLSAAVG